MISIKLVNLIRRLYNLTVEGKISWVPTESEDMYQFDSSDFSIRVSSVDHMQPFGITENRFEIEIFNSNGKIIESYRTQSKIGPGNLAINLSPAIRILGQPKQITEEELLEIDGMLESIFNAARHQAESVDRALDEIMIKLDSMQ